MKHLDEIFGDLLALIGILFASLVLPALLVQWATS